MKRKWLVAFLVAEFSLCDFNSDKTFDIRDVQILANAIWQKSNDVLYDITCELQVNVLDLQEEVNAVLSGKC